MTSHFRRMATMDRTGCGKTDSDNVDFTAVLSAVTCGNCKRSKAYKAAQEAHVEARREAVTEWRNGPRIIEYPTTEAAYDATMSDDTIADGTVLVVRGEGVVGVLMNAWPVAVTVSNGQFHHTINPPASGTDKAWDKATKLAAAMGFPLPAVVRQMKTAEILTRLDTMKAREDAARIEYREQPALMGRIRDLSARYAVGSRMTDDSGVTATVTEVSKGMVWLAPDGAAEYVGFDVEHPAAWRIADDVEVIAPFRTRSKVKSTSRARRFRKGA